MKEIAQEYLGGDFEGEAEIDWGGTVGSEGLNVEGIFQREGKEISIVWDAAWQNFDVKVLDEPKPGNNYAHASVSMPGHENLVSCEILDIHKDKDGIMCVYFAKDGVVGAEALKDFIVHDSPIHGKVLIQKSVDSEGASNPR